MIKRETKETQITLDLKQTGEASKIKTPIPFLNHMLDAFSYYAGLTLILDASGDLEVDDHHLVEDIGIVLGQEFKRFISEMKGFKRFGGSYIPMDEALSRVVIDISNRPTLIYHVDVKNSSIGLLTLQNVKEFFKAFVNEARVTLHIENLYGENDHHIIESVFKAFGKALKEAITPLESIQSTKGVL
jgi:imidazoleglycerol-phosphate dehydratase